jgi:calcineurin-like phosphoesterase family protein
MDNAIVDRWNKVVGRGDVVYHLGDVAFLKDHEYFKELIGRLNGEKHLIIGSHDKQPKMFYLELGFASAQDRLVIDRNVLLEHERVEPLPRGVRLQIHGHEHSRMRLKPSERHVCVSVELTGMAPVDLDEIMADHGLGRIKRKEQR